ncbi:MAG: TetR/AcrR family transcriptional regulator [Syntrophobacterales bacterium]|nr:TetR/AcrR family transcriptional regulator [Syntrophobacterales bacterium]
METSPVRPTFLNLPPEKRERIIDAALAEFADKGYEQASLNAVVAASGIAKGSLYQYFTDKQGIFLYLFEVAVGVVRRTLLSVKEETREADVFTRLEKSLGAGVDFIRRHPRLFGLYLRILYDQRTPRRQELLQAVRRFAADYFTSLVRQGLSRGEIRADVPREAVIFLLDAVLDRFLQAVAMPAFDVTLGLDRAAPEEVAARGRELIELLRRGLAPPAAAGAKGEGNPG